MSISASWCFCLLSTGTLALRVFVVDNCGGLSLAIVESRAAVLLVRKGRSNGEYGSEADETAQDENGEYRDCGCGCCEYGGGEYGEFHPATPSSVPGSGARGDDLSLRRNIPFIFLNVGKSAPSLCLSSPDQMSTCSDVMLATPQCWV